MTVTFGNPLLLGVVDVQVLLEEEGDAEGMQEEEEVDDPSYHQPTGEEESEDSGNAEGDCNSDDN